MPTTNVIHFINLYRGKQTHVTFFQEKTSVDLRVYNLILYGLNAMQKRYIQTKLCTIYFGDTKSQQKTSHDK